jgi:hypothetical protein
MTDGDLSIEEKRVFSATAESREVFVAAGVGCVVVDVSDDRVGGFRVDHRCTARDVAGAGGRVAVATGSDVLVAPGYEPTGFGPAVAVGLADDGVVALAEDGRVGRLPLDATPGEGGEWPWRTVGRVEGPRAVDGRLVAAAAGVSRVVGDDLRPAGLDDVRDVAAAGPFAATGSGLFYLANGWMDLAGGPWDVVDAAPDGTAHAAGADGVRRRVAADGGEWRPVDLPVEATPVGFAYGDGVVYAVTADGTFLVDAGDGPRTQALGLRDVAAVAVP